LLLLLLGAAAGRVPQQRGWTLEQAQQQLLLRCQKWH
jgi:hypothetical protein